MEKLDNYFGVPSEAELVELISSDTDLDDISHVIGNRDYHIAGAFSNTVPPSSFKGIVIKSNLRQVNVLNSSPNSDVVFVEFGSGLYWDEVVDYCVSNKYVGVENLSKIPGVVGGAVVQNIGAYGVELSNVLFTVKVFDFSNNTFFNLTNEQCRFSYRHSIFKSELKDHFFIVSVVLELRKQKKLFQRISSVGFSNELRNVFNVFRNSLRLDGLKVKLKFDGFRYLLNSSILTVSIKRRLVSYVRNRILIDPNNYGNCGCFFVCPIVGIKHLKAILTVSPEVVYHPLPDEMFKISACSLIKGVKMNGIVRSGVKTDFNKPVVLFNVGGATSESVRSFSLEIQEKVKIKYGIDLHREVVFFE